MEARRLRAAGAVVAVVALAYLVAVGATGLGAGATTGRFVSVEAAQVSQVFSVVLGAVMAWAFYELLVNRRMTVRRLGGHERLRPWHLLAAALIAVAVLVGFRQLDPSLFDDAPPTTFTTGEASVTDRVDDGETDPAAAPGWHLWAAAAVGIVALAGLVTAGVLRRPRRGHDGADIGQEEVAASEGEPPSSSADSGHRVFAAYRRVEAAATGAGLERPHSETVRAHLRRLGGGAASGAADDLAAVYDGVRFSTAVPGDREAALAEKAGDDLVEELR